MRQNGRTRGRLRSLLGGALALAATAATLVPTATARAGTALRVADDGAQIVQQTWIDQHTFDLTVQSPDLGPNVRQTQGIGPLPHIRIVVPDGWSADSATDWPVVYAYHGGDDDYVSWTRSTDITSLALKSRVMVVMPEGGLDGSFTDWFNYGRGGTPKWESWDLQEVFQLVERNFHASATDRAAMGLSSGGGGALSYAAMYPGTFRYVASFSGLVAMTPLEIEMATVTGGLVNNQGDDPFAIWGIPLVNQANWNLHDPYQHTDALRGLGIYLSSGTTGRQGPLDGTPGNPIVYATEYLLGGSAELSVGDSNNRLINRMRSEGAQVTSCTGNPSGAPFDQSLTCGPSVYSRPDALTGLTTDIYGDGWHQWGYWQIELHKAWPLIMASLGARA